MTYPPQNGPSDQSSEGGSGYPDYSSQSGFQGGYGQGPYGVGQGSHGVGQGSHGAGQGSYAAQGSYGAQTPAYSPAGAFGNAPAGRPGPPSNVGWAVASILFFWPLSFVAMTRALDVYPLWAAGRHAEAEAASASAKKLGVISLLIVAVLVVLYFVFMIAVVGLASSGY